MARSAPVDPASGDRFRVARDYECAYPEPLSAAKGSEMTLGRKDSEWPGWVWCRAATGQEGWVPRSWLEIHRDGTVTLLRDYTARELSVKAGDLVTASFTESGWAWVTDVSGGSGWVPLEHLTRE